MVRSKRFYWAALATAFVFYAATFFWLTSGWLPGVLGLLLLPVIIWAADALGLPQRIRDVPVTPSHPRRRFILLRSKVGLLLDIVKRVNWLAVDMDRGIRTAGEVEEELDKAVERMKGLVDEIRHAAGQVSEDPDDPGVAGDPEGEADPEDAAVAAIEPDAPAAADPIPKG